ncbi:MAG: ATP-binding protein [Lachnospiraceae bacterium]|uniref:AAA family ATPase n=1 Tax=Candidatus Merdisoma sp. JLR.KK006 TaxID=3112626 RepID=UPI002FEF9FE4|nr:ATP-binding protein [Lachnospiraceae bacterium]
MLQRFKVQNFKNFRDELVWDFSNTKSYEFHQELVPQGILKNAIVFGENASGKTNLGWALMDIVIHLTDSMKNIANYRNYVNLNSNDQLAHFEYTFCFDGNLLAYYYEKEEVGKVLREKVSINHREVLSADLGYEAKVHLKGAEGLNLDMWDGSISFVKYVARNTVLDKDDADSRAFMQFIRFVEHMFWFSSADGNNYIGFSNRVGSIGKNIVELDAVDEFREFLHELGIDVELVIGDDAEGKNLYCRYKNKLVLFQNIWSSGTRALAFLFLWYLQMRDMSFVFIDEFDAFYHYELAETVVRKVLALDTQVVFTSHNTDLMTNELLRPDCYFELSDNQIKSFADRTSKALRQAHNIQKMYKAGAFDER